jgi:hypothetical protein
MPAAWSRELEFCVQIAPARAERYRLDGTWVKFFEERNEQLDSRTPATTDFCASKLRYTALQSDFDFDRELQREVQS